MWRFRTVARLCVLVTFMLAPILSRAQQSEQSEGTRKVMNRVTPQYPALARTMNLKGLVRAEAVVAPNGTVKSVEGKGGHPVLVQAAQNAIRQWKYEPSSHETRESIEIQFNPSEARN
jgi:TonB family protein